VIPGTVKPVRFFIRFVRCSDQDAGVPAPALRSLEEGLLRLSSSDAATGSGAGGSINGSGQGRGAFEPWEKTGDKFGIWRESNAISEQQEDIDGVGTADGVASVAKVKGPWTFDDEIAARFEDEARHNIPGYDAVVKMSCDAACRSVGPGHMGTSRVIDVGCAIGFTLKVLLDAGFRNVFGVDNSASMLNRCREEVPSSAGVNVILEESSKFPQHLGPFEVVLVNWTLHFVSAQRRGEYLSDIFQGLAPGGLLVLTEKTTQSPHAQNLYHDWKIMQGMTREQVAEKAARLEGVLTTFPLVWYFQTLSGVGFQDVDVLHALHGFVTLQARKPPKAVLRVRAASVESAHSHAVRATCVPSQLRSLADRAAAARALELGFLPNEELWDLPMNISVFEATDSCSEQAFGTIEGSGGLPSGCVTRASLAAQAEEAATLSELPPEELFSDAEVARLNLFPSTQCIPCMKNETQQHLALALPDCARLELRAGPEHPLPKEITMGTSLISYLPTLVYMLRNRAHTPYMSGNDVDRTLALGRLFNFPVIDRSRTLSNGLRVRVLHEIPAFDPAFDRSLEDILLSRARQLLDGYAGKLHLLWSGGIDSTAMVLAFKRVATYEEWADRLAICYCPRSCGENPVFFEEVVKDAPGRIEIVGHLRDFADGSRCVVLADPADMLFGTGFMASACRDEPGSRFRNRLREVGLDAPWHDVIPAMLRDRQLLAPGEAAELAWRRWITPFLVRSPVAVQTVFDFLWWTSFALKWQHDLMRFFYNRPKVDQALVDSVKFFYVTDDFQQWSFHHHEEKMQDKKVWASYKWPLKEFILRCNGDRKYYAGKIKIPSSSHSWGYQLALDDNLNTVQFGRFCVSRTKLWEKYGNTLNSYLEPHASEVVDNSGSSSDSSGDTSSDEGGQ